jgi:25S rRNA (adenine2142-N1)-methyltransferase
VLNFVGSPVGRYDMLKRTTLFLRECQNDVFPALFIVLPLPCIENSRYLTMEHFLGIMGSLGYILKESKTTKRMGYWLFHWNGKVEEKIWKKKVICEGGGRNNFAICSC